MNECGRYRCASGQHIADDEKASVKIIHVVQMSNSLSAFGTLCLCVLLAYNQENYDIHTPVCLLRDTSSQLRV